MMKKALLVTTVSGFIPQFEMNDVKILQEMGYEVHYATNYNTPSYGTDNHRLDGTGIIRHQIDFTRSPYKKGNFSVYKQLKTLMQTESFDLVHCHTPMGGVMARLASIATKTGPVIYTAHGFHFFKGAPLLNWLCYYPIERWLSKYTDQQICINKEDYCRAKTFYAKRVDYIPSVGIDLKKIPQLTEQQIREKRRELRVPDEKTILLSAGELIRRKNHESVIRAIAKLQDPLIVYVIAGHGELDQDLHALVKNLNVGEQVIFAGYRFDILELYQIADLYIFPSYQEGLPMALLEAMSCGLPVVCSEIRGSTDLLGECQEHSQHKGWNLHPGGAMVKKANDVNSYAESIHWCLKNKEWLKSCGERNRAEAQNFSLEKVEEKMREIYQRASAK